MCLEQVALDALFPSLPDPNHPEQFFPMGDRSGLLRQVIAPVLIVGQGFDEKYRPFMAVSISLEASWFRVGKTAALEALKGRKPFDVFSESPP